MGPFRWDIQEVQLQREDALSTARTVPLGSGHAGLCHRNQLYSMSYSTGVINHFKLAGRVESCLEYKYKLTLISHEISKIPYELPNHILFPLFVKNRMVLSQHSFLILLAEHKRWILQPGERGGLEWRWQLISAKALYVNFPFTGDLLPEDKLYNCLVFSLLLH